MQYDFFRNLEDISKTGAKVLMKYLDECHAVFAPYANASCEFVDVITDGACEADRPWSAPKKNKKRHSPDVCCSASLQ